MTPDQIELRKDIAADLTKAATNLKEAVGEISACWDDMNFNEDTFSKEEQDRIYDAKESILRLANVVMSHAKSLSK